MERPTGIGTTGDATAPGSDRPAAARPLWLAPTVVESTALREPGPDVAARRQARRDAGLDEDGLGYPRAQLWLLAVLPASVIAVLCLAALIIGGPAVWGVVAAGAAAVAGGATGYVLRDPLRVSSAERRALVADRSWHSRQAWTGALADTPERRLLDRAQYAVSRLVRAPAWSTPAFEEHRLRVDLKAELDEIDRQAHELAVARPALSQQPGSTQPGSSDQSDALGAAERSALVARVDALSAYAEAVAAVEPTTQVAGDQAAIDDGQSHRALTATVRDEFATDQWIELREALPADQRPTGHPSPSPDQG